MMKSILFSLALLPSIVNAEPVLICEYGGTMILTVPRSDYEEEPNSILKIVVWNGQTTGKDLKVRYCQVEEVAMVIYEHTTNEERVDEKLVPLPNPQDIVTVRPFDMYTIENYNREIEENSRQEFYVYDKVLG
jgi:hypothetical protein